MIHLSNYITMKLHGSASHPLGPTASKLLVARPITGTHGRWGQYLGLSLVLTCTWLSFFCASLPSQRNMSKRKKLLPYWYQYVLTPYQERNHLRTTQSPHFLPAAPPAHLVLRCRMVMTASPLVTKMCGTAGKRDEANLALSMRGTSHQYNKANIFSNDSPSLI